MPLAPRRAPVRWALAAALAATVVSPAAAQDADARLSKAAFDASTLTRVAWDGERGAPQFLAGDLGVYDAAPAAAAQAFLTANAAAFGFDENPDVRLVRAERDDLGLEHVVVQQEVRGVPVWGGESALHLDADGRAYAWGGALHPGAEGVVTRPALSAAAALDAARAEIGPAEERASAPADPLGEAIDWTPTADLVVFPGEDGYALAYHVRLFVDAPVAANWEVFVDAQTGAVLRRFNSIHSFDPRWEAQGAAADVELDVAQSPVFVEGLALGSGSSTFGGTLSIPTLLYNGAYYLYDTTRGPSYIRTMTASNGTSLPGSYVTDADNAFTASSQRAAVDAHYGAVRTFDYFKSTHGRSSYNGGNATITSTVNYSSKYNNAFWNNQQMVYGDGDGSTFRPLVALDIAAHELTHAVTSTSAGLIYYGESGALNEAVSDIFAVMVDRDDYKIGEDSYTPGVSGDALRYLDDPARGGQPDNYAARYTGSADNAGVHTNSGIANKQAYLMIAGGTFRGVNVQAVGRGVTEKVWYRALTRYFTQSTNFSGARQGTLQAASDLYGSNSAEYRAVANAWSAVGVTSTSSTNGAEEEGPVLGPETPIAVAAGAPELSLALAPNPARTSATITVGLPAGGAVRVAVYDLLGREVAVALDGPMEAGTHPVALQTTALPAGLYVVVLDAAGERRTSQVTVVR